MVETFDFAGYVTKNNIKCSDGRTIRSGAFKHQDGEVVPLLYMHDHFDPTNILGHVVLEHRNDGLYGYGKFNNSAKAQHCKEAISAGDVAALSINAGHLKQNSNKDVLHGVINEVSLVLRGANPGAYIETVSHGDTREGTVYCITYTDFEEDVTLEHDDFIPDEKNVINDAIEHADEEKEEEPKVAEPKNAPDNEAVDVKAWYEGLSEEDRENVDLLVGLVLDNESAGNDTAEHYDDGGYDEMGRYNVFENNGETLEHGIDFNEMIRDAKRLGSLKDAFMEHSDMLMHGEDDNLTDPGITNLSYGVGNIDYLFPDARALTNTPEFIQREQDWVKVVMNGTHHSPFSRIKSLFADITMDEARARGYLKGQPKQEEVFGLLKRTTGPTTVYKKQKMDKNDIIDITDFDVVAWIKAEMRLMLDEELARAVLIGDGRSSASDDKIDELCIRPIYTDTDHDFFAFRVTVPRGADEDATSKNFIRKAVKSRKDYKGSGNPILFTTEDVLTDMLLLEDDIGHKLYKTEAELATALRVSKIVTVPVMENISTDGKELMGIIVNLSDYNIGADKGGAVSMFEDFDIDYNQEKYLIETRCSGALTKPKSAIILEKAAAGN